MTTRLFSGRDLKARLLWLVRLRYAAVAGMAAGLVGARLVGFQVPALPVLAVASLVLAYNVALHTAVRRVRFRHWQVAGRRLALAQIGSDLGALAVLLHVTGGVINPLVFFSVFHALLAAIVLSARAAYGISAWLVAALIGLAAFEQAGLWPVPALAPPLASDPRLAVVLLVGVAATLFVAVYLASTLIGDVATRDAHLQAANARLREHDHLREQTVRRVAHDLKGPLGVVQTSTNVLLEGYAGELSSRQRDLLGRIEARAGQLHRLVTRLFAITDARALATRDVTAVSLAAVVEQVLSAAREHLEAKRLGLEAAVTPNLAPLPANHDQLVALLAALVDNAVAYTPEGGRVRVEVNDEGSGVEVVVADTGVGIPADELDQAGELMFRGREAVRLARDGNGLGLALVRATAIAYGGTVHVESPWREAHGGPCGTRVTVRLKRQAEVDPARVESLRDDDDDDPSE